MGDEEHDGQRESLFSNLTTGLPAKETMELSIGRDDISLGSGKMMDYYVLSLSLSVTGTVFRGTLLLMSVTEDCADRVPC